MQQNIRVFDFEEQEIRTLIDKDSQIWFVAIDVCNILELDREDDEKTKQSIPTLAGIQQLWTVNEPGLYALVFTSRKPEARTF